jgi:hypothetical protein
MREGDRFDEPRMVGLPGDAERYSNCFPSPEARLLRAYEAQIAEARNLIK